VEISSGKRMAILWQQIMTDFENVVGPRKSLVETEVEIHLGFLTSWTSCNKKIII
jgi:hypothetical protein